MAPKIHLLKCSALTKMNRSDLSGSSIKKSMHKVPRAGFSLIKGIHAYIVPIFPTIHWSNTPHIQVRVVLKKKKKKKN